jgi:hypothetical protein
MSFDHKLDHMINTIGANGITPGNEELIVECLKEINNRLQQIYGELSRLKRKYDKQSAQ